MLPYAAVVCMSEGGGGGVTVCGMSVCPVRMWFMCVCERERERERGRERKRE